MSAGPGLESLVDQTISVITNDGRNIVGVLKGFDQATNIILDESHERVYSTKLHFLTLKYHLSQFFCLPDVITILVSNDRKVCNNLFLVCTSLEVTT
ncbi:sm-like protein LSM8 isoform X2 [Abrus precatorius]|uniref:U6 snRNA-associated Sm-like protein LSm8 n=1 Tax=Abrus precatorius TaxID=3816 RepID=A0A8B8LB59_ABRPR|nr:sm-like protein LSM8 isoform X2 [Abrus precatorius]